MIDEELSEAIVLYCQIPRLPSPQRVVERFGEQRAAVLVPQVRALKHEFYAIDQAYQGMPAREAVPLLVTPQVRARHPEISDEAIEAMAFYYTVMVG
jgi:hypothetical protein